MNRPYTPQQIDIAFGIMSGRIDPETDLRFFDDAQLLHGNLVSALQNGKGNPGALAHRHKAEEIFAWLFAHRD